MLSTNALSVFILHHHQNGLCNKNLCSIQYILGAIEPAAKKEKEVFEDFPNLAILTKSTTLDKFQLTFGHATVGNNSLGESVFDFFLAENLDSPSVVSIKMDITFAADSDKIRLQITEVLLCTAARNLARSKKQRDWTPCNAVVLLPFLTKAVIHNGELDAGELLKIFARFITK